MSNQPPEPVESIAGYPDAVEVQAPYQGNDYICPSCEMPIPTRKQIRLAKPPKYEQALWDVLKCGNCSFIFAPKARAIVIRE